MCCSLLTRYDSTLNLTFEATKGPVEALVVDKVERPFEN